MAAQRPVAPKNAPSLPLFVSGIVLTAALLFPGCGPSTDRLKITGNVTLDGAPLDSGSIRFTSLGEKQITSGAMIEQGEYYVPREKGLTPGPYHVEITSPDVNAPPVMVPVGPGGRGVPTQPERIPPEWNTNSTQRIEVSADGDNNFVFDIVSRR